MGQQDSKPHHHSPLQQNNNPHPVKQKHSTITPHHNKKLQHEGILKLQSIPFKNSIQIQTQQQILFLQNVQLTLQYLLQGRLNTNKLFLIQDIQKLIQTLTFTLAYLHQNDIIYKDIHTQNIFYDNGTFKLMPNELIAINSYKKFKQNCDVYPSPQYIIALRCGQDDIFDNDIIQKSNIFIMGMILLQVSTLLSSKQCYDQQNYDILDSVVNQRIGLVQQYYGQKIAKIIANMLDYDYTERMNLKQLSIWVNRQLNTKITDSIIQDQGSIHISKVEKQAQKKMNISQIQQKSKMTKNNSVYMDIKRQDQSKQQKNRIYTYNRQSQRQDQHRNYKDQYKYIRQYQYQPQNLFHAKRPFNQQTGYKDYKPMNINVNKPMKLNHIYQEKDKDNFTLQPPQRKVDDKLNINDLGTRRYTKQNPYKHIEKQQQNRYDDSYDKTALKQLNISRNQYYPKVEDIIKQKRYDKQDNKECQQSGSSLTRIKQQILKSRKLIEQFKRTQGLKY